MSASFTTLLTSGKIIEFTMVTAWDWAIQLCSLFTIIWILKKLLFKPVLEFLEKKKAAMVKEVEETNQAKVQATSLKADYEGKLKNIQAEADTILKEARAKAVHREEEIIAAARQEAENIKAKAFSDIKLEEERVKAQMKEEMIEVATLMASKFIEASVTSEKQNEYINEIINEMGDVQWLN